MLSIANSENLVQFYDKMTKLSFVLCIIHSFRGIEVILESGKYNCGSGRGGGGLKFSKSVTEASRGGVWPKSNVT